jgi:hypothetical protein
MGSCGIKPRVIAQKMPAVEVTDNSIQGRKYNMYLKRQQDSENRRIIFIGKDSKTPLLTLSSNPLYRKRLEHGSVL